MPKRTVPYANTKPKGTANICKFSGALASNVSTISFKIKGKYTLAILVRIRHKKAIVMRFLNSNR